MGLDRDQAAIHIDDIARDEIVTETFGYAPSRGCSHAGTVSRDARMGEPENSARTNAAALPIVRCATIDDQYGGPSACDSKAVSVLIHRDLVERALDRAGRKGVNQNAHEAIIRRTYRREQETRPATRSKENSGSGEIAHCAMGHRQRPARVEHNPVIRDLEPIDGEMTEIDGVIGPGVDGDGRIGTIAVDTRALDS